VPFPYFRSEAPNFLTTKSDGTGPWMWLEIRNSRLGKGISGQRVNVHFSLNLEEIQVNYFRYLAWQKFKHFSFAPFKCHTFNGSITKTSHTCSIHSWLTRRRPFRISHRTEISTEFHFSEPVRFETNFQDPDPCHFWEVLWNRFLQRHKPNQNKTHFFPFQINQSKKWSG